MGKLHKIRKAFDQFDEEMQRKIALGAWHYHVHWDDKGRAIIENAYVAICDRNNKLTGKNCHRSHFPFLRALLAEKGLVKVKRKPHTKYVRTKWVTHS